MSEATTPAGRRKPVFRVPRIVRRKTPSFEEPIPFQERRTKGKQPEEVTLALQLIGEYHRRYLVVLQKRLNQELSHSFEQPEDHGTFQ